MLTGPIDGFTASICVPGLATDRAAAPIFAVIEAVVFGLMARSFMTTQMATIKASPSGGGE